MKKSLIVLFIAASCSAVHGQKRRRSVRPAAPAVTARSSVDKGTVSGRTYTNTTFHFQVTFPDSWLIPGDDFEAYMKKQGYDLSLRPPDTLAPASKLKIAKALDRVTILLTAYRAMPGTADNAIARISVEDLSSNPQIKDAVDYFDAMRGTFASMRLPPDFKYSDTQAEKLGDQQFAFIETSSKEGKKRMYATVRSGYAVMFTLTYTSAADLVTFREVLADGNFSVS